MPGASAAPAGALAWPRLLLHLPTDPCARLLRLHQKKERGPPPCRPPLHVQTMGLAFDEWDLDYYTSLFTDMGRDPTNVELFDIAQSNSEHSRKVEHGAARQQRSAAERAAAQRSATAAPDSLRQSIVALQAPTLRPCASFPAGTGSSGQTWSSTASQCRRRSCR